MIVGLCKQSISTQKSLVSIAVRTCDTDTLVLLTASVANQHFLRTISSILSTSSRFSILVIYDYKKNKKLPSIVRSLSNINDRINILEFQNLHSEKLITAAGVRWCLQHNYKYFVQMKSDLSHDPQFISSMLEQLDNNDLVIGSRSIQGGTITNNGIINNIVFNFVNLILRLFTHRRVHDPTSSFRCWRVKSLRGVDFSKCNGTGISFHAELTLLARKMRLRIKEIPILYNNHINHSGVTLRGQLQDIWKIVCFIANNISHNQHPALPNETAIPKSTTKLHQNKYLFMALGGIGDTILTFASARRLRQMFPHDHITALTMWPQSAELLQDLGVFDEVVQHHFQHESRLKSLILTLNLYYRRFDTSILTYPANRFEYNVLQWLVHAKRRIGHNYLLGSDFTYLRWLLTDRVQQTVSMHNVHENLKLLKLLNHHTENYGSIDISLGPIAPEYRLHADSLIKKINKPLIGIHAGSSTYKNLNAKRWPVKRFIGLCNQIYHDDSCTPILFGGNQDQTVNHSIQSACPFVVIISVLSIRHTAAIMQQCEAFITNDTALGHLATALDVPTIMITGPTDCLEVGPFTNIGCCVSSSLNCSPCFRVSRASLNCNHPKRFACMVNIEVNRVLAEMRHLLHSSNTIHRFSNRSTVKVKLNINYEKNSTVKSNTF